MIDVINYTNESRESMFLATIESAYSAVCKLRPNLPEDIKIYFTDKGLIHGMSTGGYAFASDIINLAIDSTEEDIARVTHDLTATVFHEAFHLSMNFTSQSGPFGLLDCVIQEGAATVFEIEHSNSPALKLYGDYESADTEQLQEWLNFALKPSNNVLSEEQYNEFAYYDPNDNSRWKLYKLGTWIVSEYIEAHPLIIKDLEPTDVQNIRISLK